MSVEIKAGSNYPYLTMLLSDKDGPIDLTGAETIKVFLKAKTKGTKVTGNCARGSEPGIAIFQWTPEQTAVADTYVGEVEIKWESGKIEIHPGSAGGFEFTINARATP